MCGICGIAFRDPRQQPSADLLRSMANTIRHRGPDDEGVEVIGSVGLAHRRLAILDLSAAGHQPMTNEDGKIWIIFNGEIYNFQEIKKNLKQQHQFRSHSDTEVLIHLYEECGADMVDQLDGMFAFVIFDTIKNKILMARDAFGIKPLLFAFDENRLVFGSEIKPLLKSDLVSRELDRTAINDFFDYHWIPAPRSIYKNIRKLPPATVWELDLSTWNTSERQYWQPHYRPQSSRVLSDWVEETSAAIDASVKSQMISDVPLGTFLSGGIDSSIIAYSASQDRKNSGSQRLKTFTIDFDNSQFSERQYAERVAQAVNADAVFQTTKSLSVDSLYDLSEFYDEPFADSSLLPTYAVSKITREHVTVALSGDGGDELFSGYRHHRTANSVAKMSRIPDFLMRPFFGAISSFAPSDSRAKDWSDRMRLPAANRVFSVVRLPGRQLRASVLAPAWRDPHESRFEFVEQAIKQFHGMPPVTQAQLFDLMFYLPNDMLVKVDRASMANSLEVRVPFLTPRIADIAFQIPEEIRFREDSDKQVLRKLMEQRFGSDLANRRKQGFAVPIDQWMLQAATKQREEKILASGYVRDQVLSDVGIRKLFADIRRGAKHWYVNRSEELFALLAFDAWWTRYQS